MEQKEIVEKIYIKSLFTVSKLLEMLNRMSGDLIHDWIKSNIKSEGEMDFKKFLTQFSDAKKINLNSKVDIENVKEIINSYGGSCAYNETLEGTEFYFRAKNEKVIQMAMKEIFEGLVKNPKKNLIKLVRHNDKKFFNEKLKEIKNLNYKGKIAKTKNVKGV